MRRLVILLFCLTGLTASAQFKNIKLAEDKDGAAPLNPAIGINPKNPNNIVAGIGPNKVVYTLDGGANWTESILDSPFGVNGNPSVIFDAKGDLYYTHLADSGKEGRNSDTWLDRIVCQKSENGGKSWSKTSFVGNDPPKDQQWQSLAVHPKKQIIYATWTQFDKLGLDDVNCHSNILFSMSINAGGKWDKPVQVSQTPGDCLGDDNTTAGAVPAVGLDGRIYSAWSNKGIIFFDRSYDGGQTWLSNDLAIAKQTGGWSMKIPGLDHSNGAPTLRMDDSQSRAYGSIYIIYADQTNGDDDTDIWFIRSTSNGDNWTRPVRINADDPGKQQFQPTMAIDQTTGHIYIMYYDRRAYDDLQTDVWIAYSVDGGNIFKEKKISDSPFIPTESRRFDDRMSIAAQAGVITPIWTRMDDGKKSVWSAIIKESDLLK